MNIRLINESNPNVEISIRLILTHSFTIQFEFNSFIHFATPICNKLDKELLLEHIDVLESRIEKQKLIMGVIKKI